MRSINRWMAASLLAACGGLVACSDDGDTILAAVTSPIPAESNNFPGDQEINNNISDDGAAFSNSDLIVNMGLNIFWNQSNGHAIVAYVENELEQLWVNYYDGQRFHPAVRLRMPNEAGSEDGDDDDFEHLIDVQVLWLNTANSSDAEARARDGDALIAFGREDLPADPNLDADADRNLRMCTSYFDVSQANQAVGSSPEIRYGFTTIGTVVDFDNTVDNDVAMNVGFNDDHVRSFHFVSDSLVRTHESFPRPFNFSSVGNRSSGRINGQDGTTTTAARSGEETTFAFLVWSKGQSSGTNSVGLRLHYSEFDLGGTSNAFTPQASNGANTVPAGVTLDDGQDVDARFVVHNDRMLWQGTTATETLLFMTRFQANATPSTMTVGPTAAGSDSDVPAVTDVYGGDHDLSALYAVFTADDGTSDNLYVAKSDVDSGGFTVESQDMDAGVEDVDALFGTQINRTRQFIHVLFSQDDGTGTDQLYSTGIQTRNPDNSDARSLANSLDSGNLGPVPNQDLTGDIGNVTFQAEVADGTSDPFCNVQSDPNRLNFAFQHNDSSAITQDLITLSHNGISATLDSSGGTAPVFTSVINMAYPAARIGATHINYGLPQFMSQQGFTINDRINDMHPVVTDLGSPDGSPLIYFVRQAEQEFNDPDGAGTAFHELRIYGAAGIAPTTSPVPIGLVSTDGNGTENVFNDYFDDEVDEWENVSGLLRVQTTPLNRDIVNNPGWSGTRRHLFFLETQDTIDSFPVLRTRWFDKTNVEDDINQAEFEAAHTPALGSDPQDLDTGNISFLPIRDKTFDDDTIGAVSEFITTAGDTVGIYFQNRERFLYQEFNGSTWIMNQGLPTPQIIDNASAAGLFPGRDQAAFIFPPQRLNTCDNLNRVLAFFSKTDDGDFGERRFYLRQHN